MNRLYYKEKTSKAINDLLLTSPYFKEHYKRIPSVCRLLTRINGYNQKDKGYTSISHSTFDNIFGNEYTAINCALEALGLLKVRRTFRKSTLYIVAIQENVMTTW